MDKPERILSDEFFHYWGQRLKQVDGPVMEGWFKRAILIGYDIARCGGKEKYKIVKAKDFDTLQLFINAEIGYKVRGHIQWKHESNEWFVLMELDNGGYGQETTLRQDHPDGSNEVEEHNTSAKSESSVV